MLDVGINVFWFSKETYVDDDLPPQSHQYFHYIYILEGSGDIFVDGKKYKAYKNELYPTNKGISHGLETSGDIALTVIEIKFDVINEKLFSELYKLDHQIRFSDARMSHYFENIVNEGFNKSEYQNDIINLRFLEILMYLLRDEAVSVKDDREDIKDYGEHRSFDAVIAYMENNMDSDITLDDLASVAKMSKYHFCRTFKAKYGNTIKHFLSNMRIIRAKELMLYSDYNVSQVAYKVGFNDVRYFSKIFKQKEGTTPHEYIKKRKSNLYFFVSNQCGDRDVKENSELGVICRI
jgi:AraC-like DNA-binding protein